MIMFIINFDDFSFDRPQTCQTARVISVADPSNLGPLAAGPFAISILTDLDDGVTITGQRVNRSF